MGHYFLDRLSYFFISTYHYTIKWYLCLFLVLLSVKGNTLALCNHVDMCCYGSEFSTCFAGVNIFTIKWFEKEMFAFVIVQWKCVYYFKQFLSLTLCDKITRQMNSFEIDNLMWCYLTNKDCTIYWKAFVCSRILKNIWEI